MTDIKAHQKACFAALVDGETLLQGGVEIPNRSDCTWAEAIVLYPEELSIKPKVTRHYGCNDKGRWRCGGERED